MKEEILEFRSNPNDLPVIVIGGISPGTDSVHIYVKKAVPFGQFFQKEDENLFGANVIIKDRAGKSIQLNTTRTGISVYSASAKNLNIQGGNTYYLEVTTPEGKMLKANTTIPAEAQPLARLDSGAHYIYDYTLIVPVYGSWKNDPSGDYGYRAYYQYINKDQALIKEAIPFGLVRFNGESFSFEEELPFFFSSGRPLEVDQKYDFYIVKTDQYLKSYLQTSDLFDAIYSSMEDSEALSLLTSYKGIIPEESNIEGGIGVFGSYTRSPLRSIQIRYNQ